MKKSFLVASVCTLFISITSANAGVILTRPQSNKVRVITPTNVTCPTSTESKCVIRVHDDGKIDIQEKLVIPPGEPVDGQIDYPVDPANPQQAADEVEAILLADGELPLLNPEGE